MALPLSLHHDVDRSDFLLSDSDDDDLLPPPRVPERAKAREIDAAMRQKTKDAAANVPLHPIPAMQSAFAESLMEATKGTLDQKPKLRFADAKGRRAQLLDEPKTAKLHSESWRYRPGQKHHELWKLLAQITFGVYLMLNGMANSNEQVVNILQGHIDEVDEFLETTLEDVDLAVKDVKERIEFLKLPMENMTTFEHMLEDRTFRLQIVNGNEKIEHIISRTTTALEATAKDVDEGFRATKEFAVYLGDQQNRAWRQQRPDLVEIFDAMKGNAQGWYKAFMDLQENTAALDTFIIRLGHMVAEMDQRAGEVSRRTRFSVAPFSGPSSVPHSKESSLRSDPQTPKSRTQSSPSSSPPFREPGVTGQQQPPGRRGPDAKLDRIRETVISVDYNAELGQQTQKHEPTEDEGLFILQPRTYTPQLPEPVPSPRRPEPIEIHELPAPMQEEQPKRTSLRQRVSLKGGNLPEVIQVPPRNAVQLQGPRRQSPQYQSPRVPDSAYGSDLEVVRPRANSKLEHPTNIAPPKFPNATIPSPLSDQQYFYPVRASPHSPLQQRPWTAAGTARPHTSHTGHLRNQPSAMGLSMLSNVETVNSAGRKTLKKKRSAFGWLKKAFSLDEEERMQFEARKQHQAPDPYNEGRSPRYLDGRRIPEQTRYR